MKEIFAGFLVAVSIMSTIGAAQKNGDKLPPLKIKDYQLKNGLRVVLHEDKSTPVVAVNTWYHVGSKNEETGRTGFAHLFEHMMFQGSKNYNTDYFTPLQEAGGSINGTTNQDRTWYYETVPSNFLELALMLEADRLGGLLEAMTQEKLDNQRDVVKNERRQRVDNQPYGTAFEKIGEIMYPKGHPYNWTTIGSMEICRQQHWTMSRISSGVTTYLTTRYSYSRATSMKSKHAAGSRNISARSRKAKR
jgi:predicted Zn-dependent peptidase